MCNDVNKMVSPKIKLKYIKIIPPININIPAERNTLFGVDNLSESMDPKAQNNELNINETIPTILISSFSIEGPTSNIIPPKPRHKPNLVSNVVFVWNPKISIKITHNGIVEFNNAVIPEERYCAPQASNPCPPTIKKIPRKSEFLQKKIFLISKFFLSWKYDTKIKVHPDNRNLIPKANRGGIKSRTIFIAIKLEPQMIDNDTIVIQTFN